MTLPQGPVQMTPDTITNYIRQQQAQIDEATRQTLYSAVVSAGGLTIRQGGAFVITNITGTYNVLDTKTLTFPDGTRYQPVNIRRPPTGEPAFSIYPTSGTTANAPFFWALFDRAGHYILTDDAVSGLGLSKPYFDVALYYFGPATPGAIGQLIPYNWNTANAVWQGTIPFVSHPYYSMNFYAGAAGATTVFQVQVGTLTQNITVTSAGNYTIGPIDVTSLITQTNVTVYVKLVSTTAASGTISCQVTGSYLRGT